jgi:hypothetical protein
MILSKVRNFVEHLIILGLLGTAILPSINLGIGVSLITPISLLLIIMLPFLANQIFLLNRFTIIYSAIVLSILCSIFYSYIFLDTPETYRDFMEFFRYFQILPYLFFMSTIKDKTFSRKFKLYMEISIIFVLFISFIEYSNIFGLSQLIGNFYASEGQVEAMLHGSERLVVTGGNPNDGAIIASFFFLYSVYGYLSKKTIYGIFKVLSLLAIVLLTQSRTAVFGLMFSFSFYTLFFLKLNILLKIISIAFTVLILALAITFAQLDYISIGIQQAIDGNNASANVRFDNMYLGYERFLLSPVFGWGPAKLIHDTIIDSEYVLVIQRYGVIGISLLFIYIGSILHFSKALIRNYGLRHNEIHILLLFTGLVVFAMFTNVVFAGYQTNALLTLLIIYNYSFKNSVRRQLDNGLIRERV